MSEFRQNVTTGEWVIIATDRAKRPRNFKSAQKNIKPIPEHDPDCPFCTGSLIENEPALFAITNKKKWQLKVIENKYAALKENENPKRIIQDGIHIRAGGYGRAEVVIETPMHNLNIATMTEEKVEDIIKSYKTRYNNIARDKNINLINIFRNFGPSAGASLVHPHSQIIASTVYPPHLSDQVFFARNHFNSWGQCVFCNLIKNEIKTGIRIIAKSKHFVAMVPYASRSPFETVIYPMRHSSVFGNIKANEVKDLATILRSVMRKIYIQLNNPDYNYVIRSISTNDGEVQFYHWYIIILPKVKKIAGFEIGTGIYINSSIPEDCAKFLREINSN